MTTQISGDTGVSAVQDGAVQQSDIAVNVAGKGAAFQAFQASATNLILNTFTPVIFNDERQDTANGYNPTTGVYTVPVTGFYQISWVVSIGSGASGAMYSILKRNGVRQGSGSSSPVIALGTITVGSVLLYCSVGDTLSIESFQSSGTDQLTSITECFFGAVLVRSA